MRTPYKNKYGKDLGDELKKELSGDFEDVIMALMDTPTKYDALQLQKAMKVSPKFSLHMVALENRPYFP